jgi:dihydroorotase
MQDTLTLTRPDDWHLHLRDGAALAAVLPFTARQFARAIVMPNLRPPVTTAAQAQAYRERILAALPAGADFEPLMTLYLTDNTAPRRSARRGRPAWWPSSSTRPAPPPTPTPA